jgi:hypothetical protein
MTEKDPNGKDMHESGAKGDAGKPRMDLLPMEALVEVAKVMTYGAEKYTENGWRAVPEGDKRYKAALLRHMAKEEQEEYDSDTNLSHIAHEACNALFRLQLYLDKVRMQDQLSEDFSNFVQSTKVE